MHIPLPPAINPADRTPEAARLRVIRPQIGVSRADAHRKTVEVGAHTIVIPSGRETAEVRVGDVYVTIVHAPRSGDVVVLVDTPEGVRQVLGHSRAFRDEVRRLKFGAHTAPVPVENPRSRTTTPAPNSSPVLQLTDDDAVAEADRLIAATSALKTPSEPTTAESDRLTGLANDDAMKRYSENATDETDRLVQLAASLDDGTSSGDTEVDRLARIADALSDG
ncbi:hypothetical protein [uncultured Microbacterium sp.]|uniref:hypothetical protein n=1 Tax=uncultured Microbacterium sp. TaxID=191216 RepID=UPI0025F1ED99|nr:hypothetical protein [uncultured Microbacterium sp.]